MAYQWWQTAVFYQVYPRSFADGNGDGIGDLPGLLGKLDYLQDLGVDAIWLSPHYPSPMVDCGYDISDYCAVAPEYGTMEDFKRLVDELHRRKMHLVLDLVLNHTSDQHPWFIESRSSRDNPKHDWYVWHKAKDGGLPNNWPSTFGGSAWEYNPPTDEYYYHFFFKEQPDLNWRNPEVKAAMFEMMRFWLRLGVDGFRMDAVGTIYENPEMPDTRSHASMDDFYRADRQAKTDEERKKVVRLWEEMFLYQHDLPEVHDLMKEIRQVVNEFGNRVLIGETDDIAFYGHGDDELQLVFNFPLMKTSRLTPAWVLDNQRQRRAAIPEIAWPCNTLNNHDTGHVYSNLGDGIHDEDLAKLSLAVVLCLRGTPFLFNGEEIGMRNEFHFQLEEFRDTLSINAYHNERRLMGSSHEEALRYAARNGRDKGRTPMQWSHTVNGGFCPQGVRPWLPVSKNYAKGVNVTDQMQNPGSLWHFYRDLLHFRRQCQPLITGEYQQLEGGPYVLAFKRSLPAESVLVMMNFSDHPVETQLTDIPEQAERMFSTNSNGARVQPGNHISLQPFEIWIGKIKK